MIYRCASCFPTSLSLSLYLSPSVLAPFTQFSSRRIPTHIYFCERVVCSIHFCSQTDSVNNSAADVIRSSEAKEIGGVLCARRRRSMASLASGQSRLRRRRLRNDAGRLQSRLGLERFFFSRNRRRPARNRGMSRSKLFPCVADFPF